MDHTVHVAVEAEEQTELGLVLDLAFDRGARRILLDEDLPRVAHGLLEAERDAGLDRIDFEDLDFDFLRAVCRTTPPTSPPAPSCLTEVVVVLLFFIFNYLDLHRLADVKHLGRVID